MAICLHLERINFGKIELLLGKSSAQGAGPLAKLTRLQGCSKVGPAPCAMLTFHMACLLSVPKNGIKSWWELACSIFFLTNYYFLHAVVALDFVNTLNFRCGCSREHLPAYGFTQL
jgi:hypothetical protein